VKHQKGEAEVLKQPYSCGSNLIK